MPLYWAGLCDAVNIAPGQSRCPEAKYKKSVEPMPRSTTSVPQARAPSAKAAASSVPDGRMSRATTEARLHGEGRERRTDRAAGRGVELVRDGAADVVGLEDRVEVGHGVQATHRHTLQTQGLGGADGIMS